MTTIAIFPGSFKPPHKGHFQVIKYLTENYDYVLVPFSKSSRDNFTWEISNEIFNIYKKYLSNNNINIFECNSPINFVYNYLNNNKLKNIQITAVCGKDEQNDKFKNIYKYGYKNVEVLNLGFLEEGISASIIRNAIKNDKKPDIQRFLPNIISTTDLAKIISLIKEINLIKEISS